MPQHSQVTKGYIVTSTPILQPLRTMRICPCAFKARAPRRRVFKHSEREGACACEAEYTWGTIFPAPRIRCDGKAGLVYVCRFFSVHGRNTRTPLDKRRRGPLNCVTRMRLHFNIKSECPSVPELRSQVPPIRVASCLSSIEVRTHPAALPTTSRTRVARFRISTVTVSVLQQHWAKRTIARSAL